MNTQQQEEMMWLVGGDLSNYEILRKYSVGRYYDLMKYVVDKNAEEERRHKEILNSRQNG